MNPKELLNKSKTSSNVAFHKFVLLHRKYQSNLFCFYEGKDSHYYFPRINEKFGKNHHPILCGNKRTVLRVFDKIKEKYGDLKTAFFVDRDFDKKNENPEVYTTPCYSIENFYCSEDFIQKILKNEFLLSEVDPEYANVLKIFKKNQGDYHNSTRLFNMWYATLKNKSKNLQVDTNVSLSDNFPKKFVTIKIGEICHDYDLEKIKEKFPNAIEVNEQEINDYEKEISNGEPLYKTYRGKYEILFIIKFLKFLIEDANSTKKILQNKTTFNFDNAQVLSQLSQYSDTPICLTNYLDNCA